MARLLTQGADDIPTVPLTVCEVLQHLDIYSGRIIEVRGEFGGDHIRGPGYDISRGLRIPELSDEERACEPLVTGDYAWFSAIGLDFPKTADVEAQASTQWSFDKAGYDRLVDVWQPLMNQYILGESGYLPVTVTIAGRLDTPESGLVVIPDIVQGPEGLLPAYHGYGSNGVFPARLVLIRISDIQVGGSESP